MSQMTLNDFKTLCESLETRLGAAEDVLDEIQSKSHQVKTILSQKQNELQLLTGVLQSSHSQISTIKQLTESSMNKWGAISQSISTITTSAHNAFLVEEKKIQNVQKTLEDSIQFAAAVGMKSDETAFFEIISQIKKTNGRIAQFKSLQTSPLQLVKKDGIFQIKVRENVPVMGSREGFESEVKRVLNIEESWGKMKKELEMLERTNEKIKEKKEKVEKMKSEIEKGGKIELLGTKNTGVKQTTLLPTTVTQPNTLTTQNTLLLDRLQSKNELTPMGLFGSQNKDPLANVPPFPKGFADITQTPTKPTTQQQSEKQKEVQNPPVNTSNPFENFVSSSIDTKSKEDNTSQNNNKIADWLSSFKKDVPNAQTTQTETSTQPQPNTQVAVQTQKSEPQQPSSNTSTANPPQPNQSNTSLTVQTQPLVNNTTQQPQTNTMNPLFTQPATLTTTTNPLGVQNQANTSNPLGAQTQPLINTTQPQTNTQNPLYTQPATTTNPLGVQTQITMSNPLGAQTGINPNVNYAQQPNTQQQTNYNNPLGVQTQINMSNPLGAQTGINPNVHYAQQTNTQSQPNFFNTYKPDYALFQQSYAQQQQPQQQGSLAAFAQNQNQIMNVPDTLQQRNQKLYRMAGGTVTNPFH
ncbi:hypothetical protein EIN_387730 [Entamoeba invadens IP1]|uniref:Uncharacterized protein n=1 Tax=Entamoeba invadens IP1 TaxID=370355 RepID=A0A0A1UFX6_ENTIV|nr:hypothetical protein EIN_387730 [Entamoeba invadens IP1]ELP92009.1 hypothetical protein EIN_387730 [Entamoeba invadens IP1]|eukprot:XP_004258780.1 hypothetical protein EIN_387730 [Entamoeba invadens IP1]